MSNSDYNSADVQRFTEYVGAVIPNALTRPTVLATLFGLSLVLFIGSLAVMPILIARMRTDYFINPNASNDSWSQRQTAARVMMMVLKNALGSVLLLVGLAMMVLPGQGIITVLVALSLLNFPGKRQLEFRIIRQQHVRQAVAWIRARAGRPPLLMPKAPQTLKEP